MTPKPKGKAGKPTSQNVVSLEEAKKMKTPFRLVPDALSADTIECAKQIFEAAERGEAIGMVFGIMYRNRTFITNTAGECRRNPVFARGLLLELDDELSHRTKR